MNVFYALLFVLILFCIGLIGGSVGALHGVFAIALPYLALLIFLGGFVLKVAKWAKAPVPFRVPTTCGQERSLPWIKQEKLDNPFNNWEVLGRMFLEVVFFRSLFRNTKASLVHDKDGSKKLVYGPTKWLWLAGMVFH
jgi:hypothetical protein